MFHVPRKIIFSADDFGKSREANKNILNLVKLGKIQRVSVMVDGKFNKNEVKRLFDPKVKLDLHLTVQRITSRESRVTNFFYRSIQFIYLYLTGCISAKKTEKEWESQIEKFVNLFNKTPDGLNSHEHVHFFPPYFKIALKLCKKYKIRYIRLGKKGVVANGSKIGWTLKFLNLLTTDDLPASPACLRAVAKAYGDVQPTGQAGRRLTTINTSDFLVSLDWIKHPDRFGRNFPAGTTEIVCHPEMKGEYKILAANYSRPTT